MKNGFTIIELLIVLAIVAIIATVAVGSYDDYKRNRHNTASFGQVTQSAPTARPDTVSKCVDGFLFLKEMGGEWKPDSRGVRCEK